MGSSPSVFGDFILMFPLAQGGMAEVYLARPRESSITGRLLVIKKILSNAAFDPEFVELFKQEVSISLSLSHKNIVQTYDYGIEGGEYYLALEYVPGKSLAKVLEALADGGERLPLEHACFVVEEICSALAFTHSYRDPFTGEYKSIIHRDISPQNILVGQIGCVKLFDFGIAKVEDRRGVTKTGLIRGKPAYLSPEQATQKELDGRSDLFTLGIVFWEALTGRRLFLGNAEQDSLQKVLTGPVPPPSSLNSSVPMELDRIVLKSLERDKYKRYQLAQEFQKDIHQFLQQKYPGYGPDNLAEFYRKVFSSDIEKEEAEIRRHLEGKEAPDRFEELAKSKEEPTLFGIQVDNCELKAEATLKSMSLDVDYVSKRIDLQKVRKAIERERVFRTEKKPDSKLSLRQIGFALVTALLFVVVTQLYSSPKFKGVWSKIKTWGAPAALEEIPVTGIDERFEERLRLVSDILDISVSIDGKLVEVQSGAVVVPKNKKVKIRVSKPGYEPIEWERTPGSPLVKTLDLRPAPDRGRLYFSTTPVSWVKIYQHGRLIYEGDSPLDGLDLPVGPYRIQIENSLMNHRSEMPVQIEKNKTKRVSKTL